MTIHDPYWSDIAYAGPRADEPWSSDISHFVCTNCGVMRGSHSTLDGVTRCPSNERTRVLRPAPKGIKRYGPYRPIVRNLP
jgi:hypothetical protein